MLEHSTVWNTLNYSSLAAFISYVISYSTGFTVSSEKYANFGLSSHILSTLRSTVESILVQGMC